MIKEQAPAFTMPSAGWLRDLGITGEAAILLARDGLEIAGASGGLVRISTTQISRIATGWRSIKNGPFFLTRVWLLGREKPLMLETRGLAFDGYARVVRGLAAQLFRVDGMKRIWRGSSIAASLELAIPMTLLFLAALAISIFVLDGEPWYGRPVPALTALPFALLGIGLAWMRWPRPARDLDEFNRRVAPMPRAKKQ
jgi:hypothetical protein